MNTNAIKRYTELVEQVAHSKQAVANHTLKLENAIAEVAEAYPDERVETADDIEALHDAACDKVAKLEAKIAAELDKIEGWLPK